jgi:molybdate transport system substrate-binding protein
MTDAMKDISAQWTHAGDPPLRMPCGLSSALARQIEQGAPANIFAAADENRMDDLADKKLIVTDTPSVGRHTTKPQHVTIGPGLTL